MTEPAAPDWFVLVQSIGIVGSLLFSGYALWRSSNTTRLQNYIDLTQYHRDVWRMTMELDGLERVTMISLGANDGELTPRESQFLTFVFLHMTCAFELSKRNEMISIQQLRHDVADFLTYPLAQQFWNQNSKFYNRDFRNFINECRSAHETARTAV